MIITDLSLNAFRNYAHETFHFSPHINVITGENAQGKTNLLESLFYLSRGYSHRAGKTADLVSFGKDGFFISAEVSREAIHHTVQIKYENRRKTLKVDGKKEKSHASAGKIIHTILFEPDDLRIVKAGPEKRRRFLNEELSGHKPAYLPVLKKYRKVLLQRNALLKEIKYAPSMTSLLDGWDEQLADLGTKLMVYRLSYLKRLDGVARRLHETLSDHKEKLSLFYRNNLIDRMQDADAIRTHFKERLTASRKDDIRRGSTTYGPHVDDIIVHINGRDAKKYGSQGQMRTAAVALKLSQIEIYHEATGDLPIVLLDDILSELDAVRQEKILDILGRTQAFITCTDSGFAGRYPDDMKQIITIKNGHQSLE